MWYNLGGLWRNNVKVELIAVTKYLRGNGTPEELLEHAGRVCYRSEKRREAGSFLQARIREGHESIIEHASLTFEIGGISRACSHQLVRHRIASYSQESQRYVDLSNPEFVMPPSIAQNPESVRIWDDLVERMRGTYQSLRRLGIKKEDRWEIRALAKEMLKLAYQVAPSVFQDLYTEFIGEGTASPI